MGQTESSPIEKRAFICFGQDSALQTVPKVLSGKENAAR